MITTGRCTGTRALAAALVVTGVASSTADGARLTGHRRWTRRSAGR